MKERGLALHRSSFVVDAHCDTALELAKGGTLAPEPGQERGHVDIPRLRRGGVDLQVFALWVNHDKYRLDAPGRALTLLDAVWREMDLHRDDLHPVLQAADMEEARRQGKIGVLLSIEDGAALGGSLAALRMFHRLGIRALGLTWNGRNELAEGVGDQQSGGGLTGFGKEVVAEMDRLRMVVDVSHITERGFWDVAELTTRPFIASHSNARALCDHPRNLTDEQIKALAERGGVMGMNFFPVFLRESRTAAIGDVVAHIDHIADLVGTKCIGIGSDYDGISSTPEGLEDVSTLPRLTEALLERGYTDEAVADILGGNFRRVFEQVLG